MMARVQVPLSPEEHRRAKERAAALRVSLAEYVRRLIALDLGRESSAHDVQTLFDLGNSGGSDIARHKHDYIGDAFEAAR